MRDQAEENDFKLKKDKRVSELQNGLIWFWEEALALGDQLTLAKKEIEKLKSRCNNFEDDKNFLTKSLQT